MASNQLLVVALPLAYSMLGGLLALPSPGPLDSFGFDEPAWFADSPHDSPQRASQPPSAILKKPPREDKSLEKSATPPPPPPPPLGSAHCQETDAGDAQTRCYRCKDPNGRATYEQCSYSSDRAKARGSRSSGAAVATASVDGSPAASSAYRFGDDYFQAGSAAEPAEPEPGSSDQCRRERRDSMLCMVCRDPKTDAKYEQCSYVGKQPAKQRRPRTKARKHREPRQRQRDGPEEETGRSGEASADRGSERTYLGYPSHVAGYGRGEQEAEGSHAGPGPRSGGLGSAEEGCRSVKRDGEACTVCVDPKTGAKSEQCNYSFEPKDKAYAYSKSKSFGYPDGGYDQRRRAEVHEHSGGGDDDDGDDGDDGDADEEAYTAGAESRQESAEDFSSSYASPEYIRSESERISKKVASEGDCREERRDGMLCKICKDARSGDDLEQCNYSHEPEDKVYAYSKSKHFGSASPAGASGEHGGSESAEETPYSSPALDYLPIEPSGSQHSSSYARPAPPSKARGRGSRVDSGFYDASKRRAEIEKIVQAMGARERSRCRKSYRGGMTCYSCRDDEGFSDEECVFVTEPGARRSSAGHDSSAAPSSVSSSSGGGGDADGRRRRRSHEAKKEDAHEEAPLLDEELHEAEAYDYVAETRPLYDKVLGISLPAYMVNRSKQELEFDRSVENAKF